MPTRLNIVRLAAPHDYARFWVFNMFNRVGIAPRVLHGNSSRVALQLQLILSGVKGRVKGPPYENVTIGWILFVVSNAIRLFGVS